MVHAPVVMPVPGLNPGVGHGHLRNWRNVRNSKDADRRTSPGDDAKSNGSADKIPVVSARCKRRKCAAFVRPRQRSTGQPWVKPGNDGRVVIIINPDLV